MDKKRCDWCIKSEHYKKYHDEEWGVPVYDDTLLFEYLLLETFQAGLSWITILNKRENFRTAFDTFNYEKIAQYDDSKVQELLQNTGIVRNKLKIYSAITNAQAFIEIQQEFGSFSKYIWNFVDGKPIINHSKTLKDVPATTALSDEISKNLKKSGFKFVGSTVVYAFMQATGIVNDHVAYCWKSSQLQKTEL